MSSARPKRKATNRAYDDSIDESLFEEQTSSKSTSSRSSSGSNSRRRSSKKSDSDASSSQAGTPATEISSSQDSKSTPATDNPSGIPYNWQPLPEPVDYFSHKLNLKAAFVDITTQTLYCPNQPLIPRSYSDQFVNIASITSASSSSTKRRKSYVKDMFKIKKHDFIYMISEPPGEPYYIGSVMGFTKKEVPGGPKSEPLDGNSESLTTGNSTDSATGSIQDASNFLFKIQWYYRPRDISKSTSDSRLLYASMHTDTCPLSSFRGLVTVKLKSDIENGLVPISPAVNPSSVSSSQNGNNKTSTTSKSSSPSPSSLSPIEAYSQQPNCFYFDKLFDRYMVKFYDIISTQSLLIEGGGNDKNQNFLEALNKRFEFIFVESTIVKAFVHSFASTSCNCEKCGQWCSNQESVNCVVCSNHYHMYCLDPPLLKKPSRGFSWSCALCTKKHDLEHQRKKMIMLSHDNKSSNEKELTSELSSISSPVDVDLEKVAASSINEMDESGTNSDTPEEDGIPKFESMAIEFLKYDADLTLEQRRIKEEWNMRYLGMHARLEDGVDIEDRSPYPRASTRLGTRHQATNIPEFEGHKIVYYDNDKNGDSSSSSKKKSSKKSSSKSKKSNGNDAMNEVADPAITKMEVPEEFKDLPQNEYPDWLQPRPKGYIERGEDDGEGRTCTLLFKPSESDLEDDFANLDTYVEQCYPIAEKKLNLIPTTPNFMDAILNAYMENNGDVEKSLKKVSTFTRKTLNEPTFTKDEIKKFEDGVRKYGSELYPTYKEVKTQPCAMIVRFYYLWKKTANGRKIWGNFEGRIQKKIQNAKEEEKQAAAASNQKETTHEIDMLGCPEDDSSYENDRIINHKKKMTCKNCLTNVSIIWYRVAGFDANSKPSQYANVDERIDRKSTVGLCFRCARMWRRYAIVWEDPQEVRKKNTKGVGGWKKKVEYELVRDSDRIIQEGELLGGINYTVDVPDSSIIPAPVHTLAVKPTSNSRSKKAVAASSAVKKVTSTKSEEPPKKKRNTGTKAEPSSKTSQGVKKEVTTSANGKGKSASAGSETTSRSRRSQPKIEPVDDKKASKAVSKPNGAGKESQTSNQTSNASPTSKPNSKVEKANSVASANGKRKRDEPPSKAASKKPGLKSKKEKEPQESNVTTNAVDSKKGSVKVEESESAKPTSTKRQRKAPAKSSNPKIEDSDPKAHTDDDASAATYNPSIIQANGIINPNFNKNYILPVLSTRGEKKSSSSTSSMTKELLRSTIEQFRPRQLIDVGSQLPIYQIPAGAVVDLPFPTNSRKCCVCQEIDEKEKSLLEMLICANCGVNVHASCVGNIIPSSVSKPVKEWLCEPCVNDLNPQYSTLYSCGLCLANESNYELAMLGSDKVTPDFLKPISDSGKWCHLLCAIFNSESVNFKMESVSTVLPVVSNGSHTHPGNGSSIVPNKQDGVIKTCSLESTSEVYVKSYDSKCGICHSGNGSLVRCDLCQDGTLRDDNNAVLYHPICAQDTQDFKIGFKIDSSHENHSGVDRDNRIVSVKGFTGRLKPVVICSRHPTPPEFLNFRDYGRRASSSSGEEKPVIQLFIEDILRSIDQSHKLSGPQAKANNYIKLTTLFEENEKRREDRTYFKVLKMQDSNGYSKPKQDKEKSRKSCKRCEVTASPMWWPVKAREKEEFHCQNCYHELENREADDKSVSPPFVQSQSLLEILNEPLTGERFGLRDNSDRLTTLVDSSPRSKISLGDILS